MERRKKGESHFKQSIGFILPLLISFFGNFTYFYGNQMEGTLLEKDLTYHSTTLDETFLAAKSGLNNSTGLNDLEVKLNVDLEQLRVQIEDQGAYNGCGKECQKIWSEIEKTLSDYNLKYNNSSSTNLTKVHNKKFLNFKNTALAYFNSLKTTKENEINTKLDELSSRYLPISQIADSLLRAGNEKELKIGGVDLITKMIKANNLIGKKAEGFLTKYTYKKLVAYEAVNAKDIKSVLNSAFVKKDNNSAMLFSFVLSLVIDLITLGFVFLALSYNKQRKTQNTGPRSL